MKAESINTNTIGATGLCYLPGRIHLLHRKFQFGCSFSITNCGIRSWDHYTKTSSDLMRLMPNSVICWGKKWIKPWKKGSELRSTGCRRANTGPCSSHPGASTWSFKNETVKNIVIVLCPPAPLPAHTLSPKHTFDLTEHQPTSKPWPDTSYPGLPALPSQILLQCAPNPVLGATLWCPTASPLHCTAFKGVSATEGKGGFTRLILMGFFFPEQV